MRGASQLVQPEPDDGAALAGHRRHVGDGADGGHCREPVGRKRVPGKERCRELVRQSGTGQVGVRVGTVRPVRIHHRHGARQDGRRKVVVGDHDVEAERARHLHFGRVAHPAVAGDDEPDATRAELPKAGFREAVALRQARRNVAHRVRAEAAQGLDPDDDGGHPVRVVVAPDRDSLTRSQRLVDAVEGAVRICHA